MAESRDKYINQLDPKLGEEITGSYSFVIQEPEGSANTTYQFAVSELVQWIQDNTNYTEVYDFPIKEDVSHNVWIEIDGVEKFRVDSTGKVGIGTISPVSVLNVYSSDEINGDIMISPESSDTMGLHVTTSGAENAKLKFGRKISGDASFVELAHIDHEGNTEFNSNSASSVNTFNGFTVLGDDSNTPEIKMLRLRGTAAGSADGITNIAHGLTYSEVENQIISVTVMCWNDANSAWIPHNSDFTNSEFTFRVGVNNVIVTMGTLSTAIQSQPIVCTIMYEKAVA